LTGKVSSSHQTIWTSGILLTLRGLAIRPGHSIREYIEGKRINHFHFIGLIFVLIIVEQFLKGHSHIHLAQTVKPEDQELTAYAEHIVDQYSRVIALCCIPLFALISFLLFRKSGLNFAEHMVLNGYRISGSMIIFILAYTVLIFVQRIEVYQWLIRIANLLSSCYIFWFVFQFFSKYARNKFILTLQSIATLLGIYLTQFLIALLLVVYLSR